MNETLQAWLRGHLDELKDQNLYKPLITLETPSEARVTVNGKIRRDQPVEQQLSWLGKSSQTERSGNTSNGAVGRGRGSGSPDHRNHAYPSGVGAQTCRV